MRLYHDQFSSRFLTTGLLLRRGTQSIPGLVRTTLLLMIILLLAACSPPQVSQGQITVGVTADGKSYQLQLPAGSTVQEAMAKAGIVVNSLDRAEPPEYTVLTDGASVHLVRITEEFEVEQEVIPFEHQVLRNKSLPAGETRLSQPGANGLEEITHRRVFEDGVEVSNAVVKTVIVKEAVPEIVMVGSQSPFASLSIAGKLAYLSAGNAWIMEGTTGNRRPIVTTSDLDGRIFSLSPDGNWLLFTRRSDEKGVINTLWAARTTEGTDLILDLKVGNVVHFAAWGPDSNTVAFSTVEPRDSAPGWQANNDLNLIGVSANGFTSSQKVVSEPNSGGVYGWWGTEFTWSPDGGSLAYARPDGIGVLDLTEGAFNPMMELLPLQTGSDWAWVPGVGWGTDGNVIYTVQHVAPPGDLSPEESSLFDLVALPLVGGTPVRLASQVGMFAYPVPSPLQKNPDSESSYQVAFLQAVFPNQSETSRYRLVVMDRDGSNRRLLFPTDGTLGLEPQRVVWSPEPMGDAGSYWIALRYQDNIWLVNLIDGQAQQITGDGMTSRLDWK